MVHLVQVSFVGHTEEAAKDLAQKGGWSNKLGVTKTSFKANSKVTLPPVCLAPCFEFTRWLLSKLPLSSSSLDRQTRAHARSSALKGLLFCNPCPCGHHAIVVLAKQLSNMLKHFNLRRQLRFTTPNLIRCATSCTGSMLPTDGMCLLHTANFV